MTTIAHLTDLHLLEEDHARRRGAEQWRLTYLTLGRSRNATSRRRRAADALREARLTGADHLVITGDLTEDGVAPQFEVLAAVLAESGWDPARVTLVPGNHDTYTDEDAWARALTGPLRAFAGTSTPGVAISLKGAQIMAVSTAFLQPVARSAGAIPQPLLSQVASRARQTRRTGDALVLAQHHPPLSHPIAAVNWLDGLLNHAELTDVLHAHDHVHVLHGHAHRRSDTPVRSGARHRIFCAPALVDSASPLRLYHVRHGQLWAEPLSTPSRVPALAMA